MNTNNRSKFMTYFLGVLQAFIGLTASVGGFRLVLNPGGAPDVPIEWLSNSPFTDYFIPGLVLLIVIGFGNLFAGIVTFLRKRSAGSIAALLGAFLIGYMSIEVLLVGLRNFLQPLYFILGIIELILGLKLAKFFITAHRIGVELPTITLLAKRTKWLKLTRHQNP